MIPKGLFTQIAMVIVSVGIIAAYIRPALAEIGEVQNNISLYQEERSKISVVTGRLAELAARLDAISAADQEQLQVYMPDMVDTIAVPRDLEFITEEAGVIFTQVSYDGVIEDFFVDPEVAEKENYPTPHAFVLTVEGTYGQIKDLLALMEANNYPLEVRQLDVRQIDGDFLTAQIAVITYSHLPPEVSNN